MAILLDGTIHSSGCYEIPFFIIIAAIRLVYYVSNTYTISNYLLNLIKLYSLATSLTLIRVNFYYINTLSFSCEVVSYVATFYNYIYCRSSMQTKINVIASQHENNFIFNVMQSIIWPLKTKKSFFETHKYICKLSLWLIWNYISSL